LKVSPDDKYKQSKLIADYLLGYALIINRDGRLITAEPKKPKRSDNSGKN